MPLSRRKDYLRSSSTLASNSSFGQTLDKKTLAALREEHTRLGAHKIRTVPFPWWVPPDVRQAAKNISDEQARLQLGDWIGLYLRR